MDLLVSYQWGRFGPAKREIRETLARFGDEHAQVEHTSVSGIALVHTALDALDARDVVRRCRELFRQKFAFEYAIKWVPVDYWCDTHVEAIRKLLEDKVRDQIGANETWGMKVKKRRWQRYHTRHIVLQLAQAIDRKVDLDHADKLVRLDVVGNQTALSVLRPGDIFSVSGLEGLGGVPSVTPDEVTLGGGAPSADAGHH